MPKDNSPAAPPVPPAAAKLQGWFAGCKDVEGNAFSLWQPDPSVTFEQATQWQEAQQKAGAEQEART